MISDAKQRAAAIDPQQSFCVSAPAGSGKTELLIQRLLALLPRVSQPEQILAITFTRKAAAEMLERLRLALQQAADNTACNAGHEEKTRELALAVLAHSERQQWHILQDSARLNIRTIDGFCASLTRQLPVLSRFGGQVDTVENADALYQQAVNELFSLLETENAVAADLAELLLHFDNNWQRVAQLLSAMLARRDQWYQYMGSDRNPAQAEQALLETVTELVQDHLKRCHNALGSWRSELQLLLQYSGDNLGHEPIDCFPEPELGQLGHWRNLRDLLLTKKGDWLKRIDKRNGFPADNPASKEHIAQLKDLLAQLEQQAGLRELLNTINDLPDVAAGSRSWQLVVALSRVLPVLAACLTLVFQRNAQVDHSEVALSALNALGEDDAPTDLALRLDYRLEHILVDEFQDTAITQYRLLQRLSRGWGEHNEANPEAPRTLFVVGDGMQSIYGFRDANVGLFLRARDQGFNGVALQALTLDSNFRSDQGVVDWVNRVFSKTFPAQDDAPQGRVKFTPAVAVKPPGQTQAVQLHTFASDEGDSDEVAFVVEQIKASVADDQVRSIALLGRSRSQLTPILQALRAAAIEYYAQDLDPLTHSPAVVDLMQLCAVLANSADTLAWFALLRAPWAGLDNADLLALAEQMRGAEISSFEQLLTHLEPGAAISPHGRERLQHLSTVWQWVKQRRDRRALRVFVELIWRKLGCHRGLSLSALAEADVFLCLLEQAEQQSRGLDIPWLQSQLQRLFAHGGNAKAKLQVMTLHKAKGLEFDRVFIPSLERGTRSNSREMLLWDEYVSESGSRGFLLSADDHSKDGEPSLYNFLRQQRKSKEQLEMARLLYVGITRGVEQVILSASLKEDNNGGLRPPSPNSLLATIWPCAEQLDLAQTHAAPSQTQSLEDGDRLLLRQTTPPPNIEPVSQPVSQPVSEPAQTGLNRPLRATNRLDRHVGTVIHLALELLAKSDGALPQQSTTEQHQFWTLQLRQLGVSGDDLSQAKARVIASVEATLADAKGRWLLAKHDQAEAELPITCCDEQGRYSDLIIDRTFIDSKTGERWIVDYKSSAPAEGETLDEFLSREADSYRLQLSLYARALAAPNQALRCALYFTAISVLHEVDITAAS